MKQRYNVGDWVKDKNYPEHNWIQLGKPVETSNGHIIYEIDNDKYFWQKDILEKWESKVNEWCWMLGIGLIKITEISKETDEFFYVVINSNEIQKGFLSFKMLEPFIGKLPTFIGE